MIPVNLTACPSVQEEKDVKHKIRSTATATGEKCDKKKMTVGRSQIMAISEAESFSSAH